MSNWWDGHPDERFWCEIYERTDPSRDLACPLFTETGGRSWSFDAIRDVSDGDIVFHFQRSLSAVIGASIAGSPLEEGNIAWPVWSGGLLGLEQVGWRVVRGLKRPLRRFRALEDPLTADEVRRALSGEWKSQWWETQRLPGIVPIARDLFPRRPASPHRYLVKVPAGFVALFPPLVELVERLDGRPVGGGAPEQALACS